MKSGLIRREEFGSLSVYENKSYLNTWGDENNFCNSIESVALFPPSVNKDKAVKVFAEDICRSVIHKKRTRSSVIQKFLIPQIGNKHKFCFFVL